MLKANKLLAVSILLSCQIAFAAQDTNQINDKFTQIKGTIDSINGELSAQRAHMGEIKADLEHSNAVFQKKVLEELKSLQRQNQFVYDTLIAQRERTGDYMNVKPLRNYDLQTPDGKMILGAVEYVYVKEADATFVARIDTGASQSSISAQNIKEFERNGKKWIRFQIIHNDRTIDMEAPFVRQTRLVQSSFEGFSYRPIVRLNVKIGDYSTSAEFNLVDRSKMQYALLIGRPLLTDIAVVDVARQKIQKRADKDGLLIVSIDAYDEAVKNGIKLNEEYDKKKAEDLGGQIATVSEDGTESLGTDPKLSLPSVSNKIETDEGKIPTTKVDKRKPAKDVAEKKVLKETPEKKATSKTKTNTDGKKVK